MLYKEPLKSEQAARQQLDDDYDDIENVQIEFSEILLRLQEDFDNPSDLFTNVPSLYDFDPDMHNFAKLDALDMLIQSNLITKLFFYARSNPQFIPPFLKFFSWFSCIENSENAVTKELLEFLVSFINVGNENILWVSNVAEILANFSKSDAKFASEITRMGVIHNLIQYLDAKSKEKLDDDHQQLICSIVCFLVDMLDIEKFKPINDFQNIVQVGFNYINFPNNDISYHSLCLLCEASDEFFYNEFIPLISARLDIIHQVLLQVDSENEDLSQLSFDFLIDVTSHFDSKITKQLFLNCQNDLIPHLQNSLAMYEFNIPNVLKFIGNLIESKIKKEEPQSNQIFSHFIDFLAFVLKNLGDDISIETKTLAAQIYSKITQVADNTQKLAYINDKSFISNLCSLFGISQEIDYDLLLALDNLISCASLQNKTVLQNFLSSILDSINVEDLHNLFPEPDDSAYEIIRDKVVARLNNFINDQNT